MALELFVPSETPTTGVSSGETKPVTEGERMTAVATQQPRTGIFGVLDDITTTIGNGVSDALSAVVDREVNDIRTGAESDTDSTGDPDDQAGGTLNDNQSDEPFYKKYQTELMIGGGVLAVMAVLLIATRD